MRKDIILKLGLSVAIGLAVIAALATVPISISVNAATTTANAPVSDTTGKAIFSVDGMSCGGCIATINDALSVFDGITNIDVDLINGKVEILYDTDKIKDAGLMAEAITAAGYPATVADIIAPSGLQRMQEQAEEKSESAIAKVGNVDIARSDFEIELAHARNRYKAVYGRDVFADQQGRRLLENLQVQIAYKMINEAVQLQEIDRAGFDIDNNAVEVHYHAFLQKKGVTREAFESELKQTDYPTDYFMRKFRDRIRIQSYLDKNVLDEAVTEADKQKRYSDWFANAQLLAKVIYYDKTMEQRLKSTGAGGACGSKSCNVAR